MTDKKLRREYGYCDKANVDWKPSASNFNHKNLAKVAILDFQPDDNIVRYMSHVMEAAVNLEAISLHDQKYCGDLEIMFLPVQISTDSRGDNVCYRVVMGMASSDLVHFRS